MAPAKGRAHVPGVDHPREVDVDGPLERSVHLGGDVVARDRLADQLQVLHRLDARDAGGLVDVGARQRHVETPPADEFPVGDRPRGIAQERDHPLAHAQLLHRHAEALGRHVQQHPPGLRRDVASDHGVALDRVRAARAALVHGQVGAPHDHRGPVEGDVELVAHHLPGGGPGALAAVRLADVEGRAAVLVHDQPRVELEKVGIGIGTVGRRLGREAFAGRAQGAQAEDEEARGLEEVAPGSGPLPAPEGAVDCVPVVPAGHRSASVSAIAAAARFTADWIRK